MKTSQKLAAIILGSALIAAPAYAGSQMIVESTEIDIAKYDLTTETGAKDALRQITRSAGDVCGANENVLGTRLNVHARRCVKTAVKDTVETIDAPVLTEVYKAKYK